MRKKDKLLLKLLMEKYEVEEGGVESGRKGSSTGSYGLNPEEGDNVETYSEVWTEHGAYSPYSLDGPLWTMAQRLSCIEGVREVSYKTSNHRCFHFTVKGGDPAIIAEIIYRYRTAGTKSSGNLTCSFKTKAGETRQESFDYVY